jgi:hypothetical protein
MESLPKPTRARRGGGVGWLLRPALLALLLGLTLAGAYVGCRAWRDEVLYAEVKGRTPPDLRVYLADPYSTRHRTEVLARLKDYHERLAVAVEKQGGEPELKNGLAGLIRSTHDKPAPVITIAFARSDDPDDPTTMEGVLGQAEAAAMRVGRLHLLGSKELPNWFRTIGEQGPRGDQFGNQIVAVEEAKPGEFAMILIDVKLVRPMAETRRGTPSRVECSVRLQRSPEAEKDAVTVRWKQDVKGDDLRALEAELRNQCERFPQTFMQYLQTRMPPLAQIKQE